MKIAMKTYEFRVQHDNVLALALVLTFPAVIFLYVNYLYYRMPAWTMYYLFAVLTLIWLGLYRKIGRRYVFTLHDNVLSLMRGWPFRTKRIDSHNIALAGFQRDKRNRQQLTILTAHGNRFCRCMVAGQDLEVNRILIDIAAAMHAEPRIDISNQREMQVDYVNPLYRGEPFVSRNGFAIQRRRLGFTAGMVAVLVAVFFLPWYVGVLNDFAADAYYSVHAGEVYYRNRKIEGADAASFEEYDRAVARDATRVYCHGRTVPNVDVASFREIGRFLYRDRTHIYTIDPRMLPLSHELRIIRYIDATTFEKMDIPRRSTTIQAVLYKDAYHLYRDNFQFPYIKQIDTPADADMATLKFVAADRFADKSAQYILSNDALKKVLPAAMGHTNGVRTP